MSTLRKQALVRRASLDKEIAVPKTDAQKAEEGKLGRMCQVIEVSEWLETNVECMKWFSSKSEKMTSTMIRTLANRITSSMKIPCTGLFSQIIFYSRKISVPKLEKVLNGETLTTMISVIIWILCTTDSKELLTCLFGLYDVDGDENLNIASLTALLVDLFGEEISHATTDNSPASTNKEKKVYEILSEILDYSQIRQTASGQDADKSFDSIDSYEDVISACAGASYSQRTIICPQISCDIFISFFTKRKKSYLWSILQFQQQLQRLTFGLNAWKAVAVWSKTNYPTLNAVDMRFKELYISLCFESVSHFSSKRLSASPISVISSVASGLRDTDNPGLKLDELMSMSPTEESDSDEEELDSRQTLHNFPNCVKFGSSYLYLHPSALPVTGANNLPIGAIVIEENNGTNTTKLESLQQLLMQNDKDISLQKSYQKLLHKLKGIPTTSIPPPPKASNGVTFSTFGTVFADLFKI